MVEIEFAAGTALFRETDRRSDLPIVGNGPPGTFVVFPDGLRVSLPTDQIVQAAEIADRGDRARVAFGGMQFEGIESGQLAFLRVRELHPEDKLSPDRSHKMLLQPEWITAVFTDGRRVWPSTVYKIVPADLWSETEPTGAFAGSPVDARDGFIHFSTAAQVAETAARHFAGVRDLLLVAVSADQLNLRWEPSRGGDLFPHLYGSLPLTAARWVRPLPLGPDGGHVFPKLD